MKRIALILVGIISVVRLASASDTFSYTATAAPGALPSDGVDQNNSAVSVWTIGQESGVTNGGISGDYFGTAFSGETLSGWQIWSSPSGLPAGDGGWIQATNTFPGGALTVGQTVSINFEMRAADPGRDVGVALLNGTTNPAITFGIFGGEANSSYPYTGSGYFYSDAGSTYVSAGSMGYQYQSEFNISFSITGPNTYTAIAGSDKWSGTFSGSLLGIEIFNDGGGNGSDMAFNNLTVAPSLSINNIFPNDNTALFNATNTLSFSASSAGYAINTSGVQVILNGTNISSSLQITGGGSDNISVVYTNLALNQSYSGSITVSNAGGAVVTSAIQFDTFSTNYYTWEAEDFDFNGGQFIDNSLISTTSVNSYYNTVGVSNIDEYVPNYNPTNQPHLWRTNDEVSIALAGDTQRAQFTAAGIPDYLIGYFNPGNWVNFTRTYPAGVYNVYGRLANGNGGSANCSLAEVISGQGTTNQTLSQLGAFQFTAQGWNNFNFIPLTDASGNLVAIKLNGQTTFRVTSGPLGGGINANFFMLVPGSNTPPAIANIYPDGLQPFETTNALTFTVSSVVSTVSQANIQVTLNGANVSSQLTFTGSSTNWSVSLPLTQQGVFTVVITATDAAGHVNTHTETFNTLSINNYHWMAVDYDFSTNNGTGTGGSVGNGWTGGLFINNPVPTGDTGTPIDDETYQFTLNSYFGYPTGLYPGIDPSGFGAIAEQSIDINWPTNLNQDPGLVVSNSIYRLSSSQVSGDGVGTQVAGDSFLLPEFLAAQTKTLNGRDGTSGGPDTNICEFNVAYFYTNNWLNYTRTYPAGTFNVWGRLAAGGGAFTNCTLSLVTSGVGTSNQTTQVLGSFSDPAPAGWQTYHWIELSDANNNPVYAQLSGQETLRLTAPTNSTPAGNGLNPLFFMLVPASPPFSISASVSGNTVSIHFPTQSGHNYTVLYSTSLGSPSWQTLSTGIAGDGTVHTVNDSASGGSQRFYRVQAQ
ncbi:MAG TPA: hypothetical protein VNU95_04180 [Candidatus Acidoferrales bacterium]|nr:hypothetical protein [Candidatus Acidoferrales bacterium]